jgi:magnesium-transporting ATPase (P-type)
MRRAVPWWRRLAAQLVHFFALVFGSASGLAFVAGLPQLGVAILIVVVLNGLFAFAQEERAQHAAEGLRDMLPRQVTVVRDGLRRPVTADDLVVGDVVVLAEGDRISADATVLDAVALAVDTSALTGESVPEHPRPGDQLHAGCFVVEGEARAVVTRTGGRTRLAQLADLTSEHGRMPTPLRRELSRVSRVIALVAMAVGAAFFAVALFVGMPPSAGFLFAVGVTVAVVPEGLLPTVTLSLAMGAQRMARRHALVRHLEAVQTLGSTTVICTDKTGTLTRNEVSVVEAWTPVGSATVVGEGYQPNGVGSVGADEPAAGGGDRRRVGRPGDPALRSPGHAWSGRPVRRSPASPSRSAPYRRSSSWMRRTNGYGGNGKGLPALVALGVTGEAGTHEERCGEAGRSRRPALRGEALLP